MSSENPISRRDLVTHLGAGIAGAAITAALPSAQAQTSNQYRRTVCGPHVKISAATVSGPVATVAGPRRKDESSSGPR
jgi:hypothetical protein